MAVPLQSKGPIPQALQATLGYNLLFDDTADPAVIDVWGPQRHFRVAPWVARGLCVALKEPWLGSGQALLAGGTASGDSGSSLGLFSRLVVTMIGSSTQSIRSFNIGIFLPGRSQSPWVTLGSGPCSSPPPDATPKQGASDHCFSV